jgi:predicted transcriptional regulator
MKRYYNLDYDAMDAVGLNPVEWMVCEDIEFSCRLLEDGEYSDVTRAELASHHKLSYDRMKKIVASLIKRGFIRQNKKFQLKIGKEFKYALSLNQRKIPKKLKDEKEFGKDTKSSKKGDPSQNDVKAAAVKIGEEKSISKELAIEIAEDFWLKQEETEWKRVSKWEPALERFMNKWLRNIKRPTKQKEKKVTNPTTIEEMRLFLKQMSDEDRKSIRFTKKDIANQGVIYPMVINQFGYPVFKEGGAYCTDEYNNRVWKLMLENFKKSGRVL